MLLVVAGRQYPYFYDMKSVFYGILSFLLFISCSKNQDDVGAIDTPIDTVGVEYWLTMSENLTLHKQDNLKFSTNVAPFTIVLDTTISFQKINGFGAALTGSSAYLIQNLSEEKKDSLLKALFDPKIGIGISCLRLTIGSSDFSLGNYSYCDQSGISNFAIPEIDKRDLIPVLKKILEINPQIFIIASPWSAPAWMKTSASMNGGSLKTEYLNDYARYFVKYIQAMKQEGINIDAITMQNEPQYETAAYPSMKMDDSQQSTFIKNHIGPLFKSNNIDTKILIFDHNWDLYSYPISILSDTEAAQYVSGTAFHGYSGDVTSMTTVYNYNKDKGIYFTEISGGAWSENFNSNLAWNMENVFIGGVNNYAKTVLLWNLALNEHSGPTDGGCNNCRGVVTIHDDGTFSKNVEYYSIGHFSKFVQPKAWRVANSTTGTVPTGFEYCTFMNPDNSKVVIAFNNSTSKQQFAVRCGENKFSATLYSGSLATFKWK